MPVHEYLWSFFLLLPVVAFLYASVGHGGASGYLALMALYNFSPVVMKPTALMLNILVAGLAFWQYHRKGHFRWKLFYPFILGSIPAAFAGGYLSVDALVYKKILGIVLAFAVWRMVMRIFPGKRSRQGESSTLSFPVYQGVVVGVIIGFLSGLIGIGGGIILSPVILLMQWGKMKETAAVSALFIFINSAMGLLGMGFSHAPMPMQAAIWLVVPALVGGLSGAYYGSARFQFRALAIVLAGVLAIASCKLLLI